MTVYVSNSRRRPLSTARPAILFAIAGLLAILLWSYWPVLLAVWGDWRRDPNYSVGALVPFAAMMVLWQRRAELDLASWRPSIGGLFLLIGAQLLRGMGQWLMVESIERYSFVVSLAGLLLLFGGWRPLRRHLGLLAFLLLMFPLPGRIHNGIAGPLQGTATAGAVSVLELCGLPVLREGYAVLIGGRGAVAITEACNGLRLLSAFLVIACLLALLVQRPLWQRVTIAASAIPIAMICNIARLCVTAALCAYVSSKTGEVFFHDFAGLSMMPLAMLLLWAELRLLRWIEPPDSTSSTPKAVAA